MAGNIAQEAGLMSALIMFGIGAFFALFRLSQREWVKWVIGPTMIVATIMIGWGALYAYRFGGNPIFNILASREYLFFMLAPAIYLNVRSGWRIRTVVRVFYFVCLLSLLNYLFHYYRLDLREAFFSSDHRISALITYDEWRGFRLKPPMFAVILSSLVGFYLLFKGTLREKLFAIVLISLALYIWQIVLYRSTFATMCLALSCYPLFVKTRQRLHLFIVVVPLLLLVTPFIVEFLFANFSSADGGSYRLKSYQLALSIFQQYWLLGAGEDSAFGATYQNLFGSTFFPSDLGLVGTAFKHGSVGLLSYLYLHFSILSKLWSTNWILQAGHAASPIIWACLIFFIAQSFNLILNPGLTYAQGITVASISIALTNLSRLERSASS